MTKFVQLTDDRCALLGFTQDVDGIFFVKVFHFTSIKDGVDGDKLR